VDVPARLRTEWAREPEWLAALPRLAEECAHRWGLTLEEPVETPHSLVVPAGDVVLKLNAPGHFEADHEADALAHYAGAGAVRLLARDDERRALLVERCRPGTPLGDHDERAVWVIVELLPRLWRPPAARHPFRLLADEAARWTRELPTRLAGLVPQRLLDEAVAFFRDAELDQGAQVVVNQDLHGGNVLAAEREPWLLIDPKPLVGERELDAVGVLRRSPDRRRALDVLAGELGLDRERMRGWALAHALAWDNLAEAEEIARA
jgi:streptomycin 6-kinase